MPSNFRAAIHSFRPRPDMLDNRHFLIALGVAFILHLFGMYVWYLMPSTPIIDIPVRALNVKLGDGDEVAQEEAKAPVAVPENAVSRLVHDDTQEVQQRHDDLTHSMDKLIGNFEKATPPVPPAPPRPLAKGRAKVVGQFNVRKEATATAAPVMSVVAQQYVRDVGTPEKGSAAGNSTAKDAEMVSRYTQLISLWIQKFKIYPDEARAKGMQGDTMVRIRIDRQGNIHYYELEHSTGYNQLDKAAIDMIRRANPVPAVPSDYPQGELLEFLIPVNYQLQ